MPSNHTPSNTPSSAPDTGPPPGHRSEPHGELIRRLEGITKLVAGCHARMGGPLGPEDLDEVIQETSLTAWRRRSDFRGESDIDTWLYGIARFTILARIRNQRSRRWHESALDEDLDCPASSDRSPGTLADTGMVRRVGAGFEDEGTTVAEICRRRILRGESFQSIGDGMEYTEANVKARYYRSLPRLRRRFGRLWSDLGQS